MTHNPSIIRCTVQYDGVCFVVARCAGRRFTYAGPGLHQAHIGSTVALLMDESVPAFDVQVHEPDSMRRLGDVCLIRFVDEADGVMPGVAPEEHDRLRDQPLAGVRYGKYDVLPAPVSPPGSPSSRVGGQPNLPDEARSLAR